MDCLVRLECIQEVVDKADQGEDLSRGGDVLIPRLIDDLAEVEKAHSMMRDGGCSTSVLMLIGMLIVSIPCHAENMQRETCSAAPGRGYFGGCPQMENHAVSRDVPESGFPDPMAACRQANEAVKQALTEQMKSFDRRHPGGFPSCLNLTIRCEPCGRVQK